LQATDARADDRSAAGHRFERDQTERLGERRHGANVRSRVVEREIFLIQRADEVDVRLHAVLVYEPAQLLDLLGLGCVVLSVERTTDDEETDIAPEVGPPGEQQTERAEKDVDALYLLDATDE
jgi:hypothetical protein